MEVLERMANPVESPVKLIRIEKMHGNLMHNPSKEAKYTDELKKMEDVFQGHGELSGWNDKVLDGIDKIFIESYTDGDTQKISDSLFYLNCPNNNNRFHRYCLGVDQFLWKRPENVPINCREYFTYYTMWSKMGYEFPMPLGTSSVINQLYDTIAKYRQGLCEVSI